MTGLAAEQISGWLERTYPDDKSLGARMKQSTRAS